MSPLNVYYLQTHQADGQTQMALDEALLLWLKSQTQETLVIRTYQWSAPTYSIGVHQSLSKFQALDPVKPSIPIVRRPTGGRAILHGDDISYAVVTNQAHWQKMGVNETYCEIAGWLKQALTLMQIETNACQPNTQLNLPYQKTPMCFETQTPQDLKGPDGQKLSGSAQLKRQYGLLQHGALFLKPYLKPNQTLLDFDSTLKQVIQTEFEQTVIIPYNRIEGLEYQLETVMADYTPLNILASC